jgi:hypothetical protein
MKPPHEQMSKNLPNHPTRIATLEIEQQNKKATAMVAFHLPLGFR